MSFGARLSGFPNLAPPLNSFVALNNILNFSTVKWIPLYVPQKVTVPLAYTAAEQSTPAILLYFLIGWVSYPGRAWLRGAFVLHGTN